MEGESKVNVKDILLKEPAFVRNSELDNFFTSLNKEFISKLKAIENNAHIDNIYEVLGFNDNRAFVEQLLIYFNELHQLTINEQIKLQEQGKDILPISLSDMKYVDELIKLLIIHGIDANLQADERIPIEQKQMNNFKFSSQIYTIPKEVVPNQKVLELITKEVFEILVPQDVLTRKDDYIRMIVLNGPLYGNLYLALISLHLNDNKFASLKKLEYFKATQETYSLLVLYTFLIQTIKRKPIYEFCLNELALLPLNRENGVISLVDFLLGIREDEQINVEKLDRVSQILLSKPKTINNRAYLSKLFPQILDGLKSINRPILVTCLNNVLLQFFHRNKVIINDFLLKPVLGVLLNEPIKDHSVSELNDTINILISISKNPSTEFVKYITNFKGNYQIYLHLWIYASFLKRSQAKKPIKFNNSELKDSSYFEIIISLIKSFLITTGDFDALNVIYLNMVNDQHDGWKYQLNLETNLPYITVSSTSQISNDLKLKKENDTEGLNKITKLFQQIDDSIELYIELLRLINMDNITTGIFLNRLSAWIKHSTESSNNNVSSKNNLNDNDKNAFILLDLKFLEKINEEFKSDFIKKVGTILSVVDELLGYINDSYKTENNISASSEGDSDDDSDDEDIPISHLRDTNDQNNSSTLKILLDLLSTVIVNAQPALLFSHSKELVNISKKLEISKGQQLDCEKLNDKIKKLLKNEGTYKENMAESSSKYEEDNEILDRAMVNLSDPLVPIKVNGLSELCTLIESKTETISLPKVISLHFQLIRNPDPFLYLSVIKNLVTLLQFNTKEVLPLVLEYYNNTKKYKLDNILKIGEVLINYIQIENKLFQGEYANRIIESCIAKIRTHNALDNRIRMSSMSILGVCLQVNANGIVTKIQDILDCAFNVLQLENKEKDSFLMRRSAIYIIHDLIYNSGFQFFPPQFNYNKTKTLLEYVQTNDNDYLVTETTTQLLDIMKDYQLDSPN